MSEGVRTLREVGSAEEIEVLYWVGCAAALDERLQRVARAMVRVLQHAGVRFAVLGAEERCTGDPARRTGNELHFQILASENIATLNRYGVRRIVTHCPHCLHTLRNEYPRLGGAYEVLHHSEFVYALIADGRLRLPRPLDETLVFHDPCYLGRYNGIFDAPREILDRVGARRVELERTRARSFCCGAGGGHAFFEDRGGGKVNVNRAREAVASGASTVCTACPFCLSMLEEGVAAAAPRGAVRVRDFVELVAEMIGAATSPGNDPVGLKAFEFLSNASRRTVEE
ncbi:MAG: (Fe-S)-binding protein [Gemmatimonadetes bacterium]|nr:(Fe-S)-binding protein [Gemmatimonadota bacterium]